MEKHYAIKKDRRNFIKLGLVGAVGIAGINSFNEITDMLGINLEELAQKEQEKIDAQIYNKLIRLVEGEPKIIDAAPYRGWQFYANETISEKPWMKNYTNTKELGRFYKIYNNDTEPKAGKTIKDPPFKKPLEK